jgi:hypothetical protein
VLELAGRISDHGTATSLPPAEELLEPSDPLVPDDWRLELLEAPLCPRLLCPDVLPVLPESEPEVEPLDPLDSTEMIAKSTLPEVGLMITSLMLPRFDSPEEAFIWELINLLAWMSWCWPPRPVALNELEPCLLLESLWLPELLDNPLDDELCFELELPDELPGLPELPDELWACATPTKPATQRAVRAIERFFIVAFLFFDSSFFLGEPTPTQRGLWNVLAP